MHIEWAQSGTLCQVQITGEMTIYSALELKQRFLGLLDGGPAFEVKLSQVSEMDTAGLQQLIMVRREATRLGKTLCLVEPSASACEVLRLCRMEAYFDLPATLEPPAVPPVPTGAPDKEE